MKVIVTGGSGLIGRGLVAALSSAGHHAVVLSRNPDRVGGLPGGAEAAAWDTKNPAQLALVVAGADAVVHLAGESVASGRWTRERKRRIKVSRVRSTTAVSEAIESLAPSERPAVLAQASAVGYYGARGDETLAEDAPPGDDFLAGVCRQWEAASAPVESLGVRRVLLRTGVVLARAGGALPRIALPFRLFAGGPVGGGAQWLPWIHLADEVGAILYSLESEAVSGPLNLTAPNPVRNREFARVLGRVLKRPSFVPTPGIALKLAMGEMSTIVLDGQRAIPQRLEAEGYRFRYPELEPALRDLLA